MPEKTRSRQEWFSKWCGHRVPETRDDPVQGLTCDKCGFPVWEFPDGWWDGTEENRPIDIDDEPIDD
jgi:hypothetical protein